MKDIHKVYSLNDPITNEIRYIGYTSSSLKERLRCHIKDMNFKNVNCHKNKWIRKLKLNNLLPIINLIYDNLNREDAIKKEIELISYYKSINYRLTNSTNGGEGGAGYRFSDKQKKEQSNRQIGKKLPPCSEERKRKISEANKGRKMTKEQVEKMKGRKVSEETRKKFSKIHKGKKLSEETKKRMGLARKLEWDNGLRKGKIPSEETKKKMSFSHSGEKNHFFGKYHSEETKQKIREKFNENKDSIRKRMKLAWSKRKERKHKLETIEKMRLSYKKRKEKKYE